MPIYEMPLLMRVMTRPEIVKVLKRTAQAIFDKQGFIRKIDNLGKMATPYKISASNQTHKEANYFIIHFEIPPSSLKRLTKEYQQDVDILSLNIYNKAEPKDYDCTLHEELLPPAFRPEVKKMIAIGEKEKAMKNRNKFKFNTGLNYYPFQR